MKFDPPVITCIGDVLPHIGHKPEIIRIEKEDYTVLDYVYCLSDTFDNPYAKECRGLKFDKAGNLIARPYHKFHNLNENEEYSSKNVDLSLAHHRLDKLDGSMVHNAFVEGRISLMTRKGESEVAQAAMAFLKADPERYKAYKYLFEIWKHMTFIFEYVAPTNKIVIDYAEEQLILTAVRNKTSGGYLPYETMLNYNKIYGIPVVGLYDRADVASDDEKEGTVIRFESGAMIKIKSDIYVRKHRSKDLICRFKDVIKLIIEDNLDDILPQLDEPIRLKLEKYKHDLFYQMDDLAGCIDFVVTDNSKLSQKEFAIAIKDLPAVNKTLLFNVRKGDNPLDAVKTSIGRMMTDSKRLEEAFVVWELPIWEFDFFTE